MDAPALHIRSTAAERVRAASAPGARGAGGFTLLETGVSAAIVAVLLAVVLPTLSHGRDQGRKTACAEHLRQVASGMLSYAGEYGGAFPTCGYKAQGTWRFDYVGYRAEKSLGRAPSNSRNLFLILATGHARPEQLICPNTDDLPARTHDNGRPLHDFQCGQGESYRSRFSYSYQWQFVDARPSPRYTPLSTISNSFMPLLADRTPCVVYPGLPAGEGVQSLSIGVPAGLSAGRACSPNHDRRGQNVAAADGRVFWSDAPTVGPAGDNIYTVWNGRDIAEGAVDRYSFPGSPDDAFLVP